MRYFSTKRPGETRTLAFDFSADLPSGVTVSSAGTTAISVHRGTDASPGDMLSGSASLSSSDVLQSVVGGVSDVDYLVVGKCTLSDGQVLELPAVLPVRDEY